MFEKGNVFTHINIKFPCLFNRIHIKARKRRVAKLLQGFFLLSTCNCESRRVGFQQNFCTLDTVAVNLKRHPCIMLSFKRAKKDFAVFPLHFTMCKSGQMQFCGKTCMFSLNKEVFFAKCTKQFGPSCLFLSSIWFCPAAFGSFIILVQRFMPPNGHRCLNFNFAEGGRKKNSRFIDSRTLPPCCFFISKLADSEKKKRTKWETILTGSTAEENYRLLKQNIAG